MASPTNHNLATHDPAVIYWDWEKIKIMNRPSGLPSPGQHPPWDEYFARPEKPRVGTLKRSNAFVGANTPGNNDIKDDETKMMKAGCSKVEPNAKHDFPEALYSEAKRRAVEDMGNRFMRTIKKLDKSDLGEPVDFNSILEKQWAELAEFYSTQVSTVQGLGRKLKNAGPNLQDLPPASPQLPSYLMSQLNDLKLHPFTFKGSEEKLDTTYLGSKDNMFSVEDGYTAGSNQKGGITAPRNEDEPHVRETTKVQTPTQKYPVWEKIGVTVASPRITGSTFVVKTDRKVYSECMGDKLPVPGFGVTTSKETYEDPSPELEFVGGTESAAGFRAGLDSCVAKPEAAVETSQFSHSDTPSSLGEYKRKNDQEISIQQIKDQYLVDSRDASTHVVYLTANYIHLIENHYKTLAEVMRLAAMNPGDADETYTDTDLKIPTMINDGDGTETMKNSSGQLFHRQSLRLTFPAPQFVYDIDIPTVSGSNLESPTGEQIQQYDSMEGILDSAFENIYKHPDSVEITRDTSNSSMDGGEVIGNSGLSRVESLADASSSATECAPEESTLRFNEASTTPRSLSHDTQDKNKATTECGSEGCSDMAEAESPHDSSNASFLVSDDSYLFCGSTKCELEKFQLEVKKHLEQAEKKGKLLAARWVNDSGIETEAKAEVDELDSGAKMTKENQEKVKVKGNGDDDDNGEDDSNGGDERIEVYELEYTDNREVDEGDEEINEEMEKILAWIALEDAKGEEGAKPKERDFNLTMTNPEKSRIEEIIDTTDSDDDQEVNRQDLMATHMIVGKELSVVNEEDGDEDEGDGVKGQLEGKKEEKKSRSDEDSDEFNGPIAGTGKGGESSERGGENSKDAKTEIKEGNAEKLDTMVNVNEKSAEGNTINLNVEMKA